MKKTAMKGFAGFLCAAFFTLPTQAGEVVHAVGSSTVFPFATLVAEEFHSLTERETPIIESTGTGGGMVLFCAGDQPDSPDLVNASRPMKESERDLCAANGVSKVLEFPVGYDGIVLATADKTSNLNFTARDLWLALAEKVPVAGQWVPNPHQLWSEVNKALPSLPILVYGPPPTSGTRDSFVELALHKGCENFPEVKALSDKERKKACERMREDGAYVDMGENDNLIIQKLTVNPHAIGVMGYVFFEQNQDRLSAARFAGVAPNLERIKKSEYPLARSLYVYAKASHFAMTQALADYVGLFLSEMAAGDGGFLTDRGLIPLPLAKRAEARDRLTPYLPADSILRGRDAYAR